MDDNRTMKVNLWREGLKTFQSYWREWIKVAACFFLLFVALEFVTFRSSGPFHAALFDAILHYHSGHPNFTEQLKNISMPNPFLGWITLLLAYVQSYAFFVFYLRRAPILVAPRMSLGGFFYVLMKMIQKFLTIMVLNFFGGLLMALIVGIILFVVIVVFGKVSQKPALGIALVLPMMVAGYGFLLCYLEAKYALVYPLAIEKITSSLKTSEKLMQGNIWRMVKSAAILLLSFWTVSCGVFGAALFIPHYWENDVLTLILAVVGSLTAVATSGVLAAFQSSACRTLYQEKLRADPAFTLATRT